MRYPRIIAHRCGGALAPENTLIGLRIAARLGCRGVEFDAMLGADGVPVLMHDETLERTTLGSGGVARIASSEIVVLDAGTRHHRAFAGERVPSLAEALTACAELGLWANVEIKPSRGFDQETGDAVARASSGFENVLLSSFSKEALRAAALAAGDLPRALLVDAETGDWCRSVADLGACAIHVAAELASVGQLGQLRAAGVPVACYTVNRRDVAERLFSSGVAAVFTDRPDLWAPEEM